MVFRRTTVNNDNHVNDDENNDANKMTMMTMTMAKMIIVTMPFSSTS